VRLFVAVRPPAVALADAAAAVDAARAVAPGPRWVPPDRWHLTLAFHGEVPDADVDRLVERTARRLRGAEALELALTGAGAFSRRAVWLGVTGDVAALRSLAAALVPSGRPYRPHLTVARLRGDTDPGPTVAALSDYAGPTWTAGEVHLVRSRLGPTPAYDDVATWPLTPRP
jgi:RNA 2',3'-cyclic 3'-phosphodiesterase